MKKVLTLIGIVILANLANRSFAQAPEGFVYQAEIRNDKGRTLSNSNVSLDIRILNQQNNIDDWVWKRIYDVTTDKFGMVSVIVEDAESPTNPTKLFTDIKWGEEYHYLYVKVNDGSGWVPMGAPMMIMSVPYSLYSNKAGYAENAGNAINTENLNPGDIIQFTGSGFVAATFKFYYRDADGDEYGVENNSLYSPVIPPGYSINVGDCDDDDPNINIEAEEICDGIDNNCNGQIDETCDIDGDTYTADVDCDDNNPDVFPGATERCDGVDNDCDGEVDENCIDETAIYVSPNGDDANSGTFEYPVLTISHGISEAILTDKNQLFIAEGNYHEKIHLESGVYLFGGYNSTTWERDLNQYHTIITSTENVAIEGDYVSDVVIDGLEIQSSNATQDGESSYGIILTYCTDIVIENSIIRTGDGSSNIAGSNGQNGQPGGNGTNGADGCENSDGLICNTCNIPTPGTGGSSTCGRAGGNGG